MKKIFDNITDLIGNTPMLRLNNFVKNKNIDFIYINKKNNEGQAGRRTDCWRCLHEGHARPTGVSSNVARRESIPLHRGHAGANSKGKQHYENGAGVRRRLPEQHV